MTVIFQNRGKQYKVKVGDFLKLPKLNNQKKDDLITFDEIIFMKNEKGEAYIGSPIVKGVSITAKVIDQIRDKKIIVFKKKRRHNYRRKLGHRQDLTLIKILEIGTSKSKVAQKDSKLTSPKASEKLGDNNGT